MKSVFLLCGVLGAVANASECNADENSLLQSKKSVRKHAQADSQAVLENMRDVANSLLEGSENTMTSDEVNDALQQASDALEQLSPAIHQQIENAQQQVNDAASAVQVCHAQDQADLRQTLQDNVAQRVAAVESCQDTLGNLQADEERQCGIAEDCLCDEARQSTTGQTALCASMTETYETAFCEHHHVCTIMHQCHSRESDVFAGLLADVEAQMAVIVQEYIAVEQSQCITGLIMQAMTPPITPIPHAALIACDEVDVSALAIHYPGLPQEPAACPPPTHGNPSCGAPVPPSDDLATLHWNGGSFTITAGQEGVCLPSNAHEFPNDHVSRVSGLQEGCEIQLYQHGCPGGRVGTITTLTEDQGGLVGLGISAVQVTCQPVDEPVGLATVHWNGGSFIIPEEELGVCIERGSATFPNDAITRVSAMREGCTVNLHQHGCPPGRVGTITHLTAPRGNLFSVGVTALRVQC